MIIRGINTTLNTDIIIGLHTGGRWISRYPDIYTHIDDTVYIEREGRGG